jgi:hypothetical protein
MTYYESAEDVYIDKDRVIKELKDHGTSRADRDQFFREVPPKDYDLWHAQAVLAWLGY